MIKVVITILLTSVLLIVSSLFSIYMKGGVANHATLIKFFIGHVFGLAILKFALRKKQKKEIELSLVRIVLVLILISSMNFFENRDNLNLIQNFSASIVNSALMCLYIYSLIAFLFFKFKIKKNISG